MDRRSWPWKKKSSEKIDKIPTASDGTDSQGDQDNNKKPTYIQISLEQYSSLSGLKDEIKTYEEKVKRLEDQIKDLNETLSTANVEITTKDGVVKQHAKVAEEAVSGWEKAEAEALALKNHLEIVTLSKLTVEERATHLDGALKECMRQIRNLKEEHEEKLQDVIVTKAKQMDILKVEFEAKIADFEQELLRSAAENDALSRSLQERSNMLIRVGKEKSQAEAEIEHLKNNIESCEREINSLKYEIHVVSKELEIRNEEKNMSMKSAEVANKQHMEGVKKIAKLEAECQRLRGLVRKKLPGPAALAQMKLEVESFGRDYGDDRKKRAPIRPSSPFMSPMSHMSQESDFFHEKKSVKENDIITERLLEMEEETKMLKEALAKRNSELQASRNLCAKTANRLQTLESQFLQKSPIKCNVQIPAELHSSRNTSNPPSLASMSEDGNEDARSFAPSWSTTAISELSQPNTDFKNGRKLNKAESLNQLGLMDDFLEMEKLACSSNGSNANNNSNLDSPDNKKRDRVYSDIISGEQCDEDKTIESCESVEELSPVMMLKSRLSRMIQSVSKDTDTEKILEEFRTIMEDVHSASPLSERTGNSETTEKDITMLNENDMKREAVQVISHDLANAVTQIHNFVLFLAKEAEAVHDPSSNILGRKAKELSITLDRLLCSDKTLADFIFDLSRVLAEASELKISVLGFNNSEVEIHSPDCIDKVALPENNAMHKNSSTEKYSEIPDDLNVGSPCKFTSEEMEELREENKRLADNLVQCTDDLETTKAHLNETEHMLSEVKSQLASGQKSNGLAETQLKCMAESYRSLETCTVELEAEVKVLRDKIESLENELQDEKRNHFDAVARCKDLEEQLQRNEACSVCSTAEADLKNKQDTELAAAAEKLAECQETIFLLGKQLKSLRPQAEQIGSSQEAPTTINDTDPQHMDRSDCETPVSPNLQKRGAESPNLYITPNSPSDTEARNPRRSPFSSKHPKHRHTKSSSGSSSSTSNEKLSRGFSRFFSSKVK